MQNPETARNVCQLQHKHKEFWEQTRLDINTDIIVHCWYNQGWWIVFQETEGA